jgi:hypothetical protein
LRFDVPEAARGGTETMGSDVVRPYPRLELDWATFGVAVAGGRFDDVG